MGPLLTEAPAMEDLGSAPSETDVRRAARTFSAAHSLATAAARKSARPNRSDLARAYGVSVPDHSGLGGRTRHAVQDSPSTLARSGLPPRHP
jgi:hypothetical protein